MAVVEKTIDIIGDDAFCDMLITRTIPEGAPADIYDDAVKSLRSYALRGIVELQSVHMPNVTRCGASALYNCRGLKTVEMENCTQIDERAFQDTPILESFTMPKLKTMGSYSLSGSGTGTAALTALNFPELLTMGDLAVYNRPGLVSFIAPKLQTISNSAFAGSALRQIDLPSIKTLYGTPFNGMLSLEVINLGPYITVLSQTMLQGTPAGVVVNLPFAEGQFAGAPWGNPDAVINYEVPYSGTVPMPEQEGSGS